MRKILIVEDDAANRGALSRLLRQRRLSTVETGTLKEGLAAAKVGDVDCVVLDLQLPDSSPEDTLQSLTEFSPAPVVAYTGIEDPALPARAMGAGAYSVITKGSSSDTIIEKILMALIANSQGDAEEEGRQVWQNRRDNYTVGVPSAPWFNTGKMVLTVVVAVVAQAIALVGWIWHEAGDRALELQQLHQTAAAVEVLSPEVAHLKEKAEQADRARDDMNARITKQWDAVQSLRGDMNAGFTRVQDQNSQILRLMIEQRPAAAR